MAFTAADLQMVEDHIALGERHVARQRELLLFLKSRGHPTELAEQLLADFQSMLLQHRAHREQMLAETELDPLGSRRRGPATVRQPGNRPPRKD